VLGWPRAGARRMSQPPRGPFATPQVDRVRTGGRCDFGNREPAPAGAGVPGAPAGAHHKPATTSSVWR